MMEGKDCFADAPAQPAHAADRLPCRGLKGLALVLNFLMKYTCQQSHSRLSSSRLFGRAVPAR
jgi:hypothetical protein